jgi:hypothetical protein
MQMCYDMNYTDTFCFILCRHCAGSRRETVFNAWREPLYSKPGIFQGNKRILCRLLCTHHQPVLRGRSNTTQSSPFAQRANVHSGVFQSVKALKNSSVESQRQGNKCIGKVADCCTAYRHAPHTLNTTAVNKKRKRAWLCRKL